MTLIANAARLASETIAAVLQPPPPIDLLDFAERRITFDDGPFRGPYSRQLFPFFDEILKALSPDDPCRHVTLIGSAQIGKTVLAAIFCLAQMMLGRGSFMFLHPNIENAARWAKAKLHPMMRSTAGVRELYPERANDSRAALLYKERTDGMARLLISGANSPASLSQVTIDAMVLDDLSKWEMSPSGDPEAMAESRCRAIADAKILKISTPLIEPGCRITRNFRDGSQEMPFVPCPHCSTMQVLEWTNMLAALDPAKPEAACFTCVGCGALIEERHRPQMLKGFEWRAQNPAAKRDHRSFYLWSAYSFLQNWEQIAREWLRAAGDPSAEKTFFNDAIGQAYETRGDGRPWEELASRAAKSDYARGVVPKHALILTLGIDCQLDRVEWALVGHGREYRRYIVDYGVIGKHITEADCQRNIDLLLQRKWMNHCGRQMGISLAAIDANFETDAVLAYARRYPPHKLIAVRGARGDSAPRIAKVQRERDEKKGTVRKYARQFFHVGVNNFKLALYRDLAKDDPALRGYVSFPTGLEDRFFQELVSETRVAKKRMGQLYYVWEKSDRQANEMLDCMIYASAAAIKCGTNWISDQGWTMLEAEFDTPPPKPLAPGAPRVVTIKRSLASQLPR